MLKNWQDRCERCAADFEGGPMRKIALGMAVAATALAAPAMARDGQGYFGADIGYTDPEAHKIYSESPRCSGKRKRTASSWAHSSATMGQDPHRSRSRLSGIRSEERHRSLLRRNGRLGGETHLMTAMANALLDLGGEEGVGLADRRRRRPCVPRHLSVRRFGLRPDRRQRQRVGLSGHRASSPADHELGRNRFEVQVPQYRKLPPPRPEW